jgi:hypothetical protein
VAKGRRDGHLCATVSSLHWRDSVLKVFQRSSCTVTQSGSAAMPAARAWPTICAQPGTPTASCRGERLWPTSLQVARAHSPARRYQTSPIAIGRMPPHGLDMGRGVDWRRAGTWESFPWTIAGMSSSTAISASWLDCTAALTCSYVQPLGPAVDQRGTLSSTFAKIPEVIWAGHSSAAGGCEASSCGCQAVRTSSTSSVMVASGVSCRTRAAREMLPSCSWRWMRRLCW